MRKMTSVVEIKKTFDQRSERVKSVDVHPTKPWVLLGLYSGNVCIWNYRSEVVEKTFKIKKPIRTTKFIAHKEWIVVGTDDGHICVYNYNTMESVVELEAHTDTVRSVVVHPSHSYILSASDDKLIKLWGWENNWKCVQTFQGHDHYVMQVAFNPRDANVFASVSLDCTVKTWNLGYSSPRSSIKGHVRGLNTLEFLNTEEKLYLITGSDDNTVKVWDYETETWVQTLAAVLREGIRLPFPSLITHFCQMAGLQIGQLVTPPGDIDRRTYKAKFNALAEMQIEVALAAERMQVPDDVDDVDVDDDYGDEDEDARPPQQPTGSRGDVDITQLIQRGFTDLRSDMNHWYQTLRTEMNQGFQELRTDMYGRIDTQFEEMRTAMALGGHDTGLSQPYPQTYARRIRERPIRPSSSQG